MAKKKAATKKAASKHAGKKASKKKPKKTGTPGPKGPKKHTDPHDKVGPD